MSGALQSGHHPDADQLSAFAEHALPAHEYELTLAHLAVCPDCRSVVALSMPPIADALEPQPDVVRKPWFFSWKFALPVAATVAALAIFIVETRTTAMKRPGAIATQEAELHSAPPVPPPQASVPIPAFKPSVLPSSNARPNTPPVQPAGPANPKGAGGATSRSAAPPANQSEAFNAHTLHGLVTGDRQSSHALHGVVGGISAANNAPLPQNPSPDTAGSLHLRLFNAGNAADSATRSASPTVMAGPVGGPVAQPAKNAAPAETSNKDANVAAPAAMPIVTSPYAPGSALDISRTVPGQTPLPSDLPAISVVSARHQILAIDSRNALFFSADDGKSWKSISPQWKGRAIRVALVSPAALANPEGATIVINGASFSPQTSPARAQLQAIGSTLTGTITDSSGAIISNADVIVTGKDTSDSHTVKTDNAGNYVVSNLAPGNYQIAARARGFQEQVSTVDVAASEPHLANFTLPVGSASETVTVEASSSSIPLATSSVKARKVATPSATIPAPPVFEITTDDGEHWTSRDGRTWTRR